MASAWRGYSPFIPPKSPRSYAYARGASAARSCTICAAGPAKRPRFRSSSIASARRFPRQAPRSRWTRRPWKPRRPPDPRAARMHGSAPVTPDPIRGAIRIGQAPEMGLRPGQSVSVNAIKHLEGAKWAVAVMGRVFPAISELPLQAGQVLRARVSTAEGKLVLTVSEEVPDAVRAALVRQGLAAGGEAEMIARALARSGLPILAETIERIRALLTRSGMERRRAARIAATMVDRGIYPAGPGARALLPVLGFGERGGEDQRRYRGRQLPDTPRAVKEFTAGLSGNAAARPSILQAYNHTRAKSQSWVVIPFVFTS